jgi:hypothetical protein
VDISPKYISNHYFNYEAYEEFKGTESFIVYENTASDSDSGISYLRKNNGNSIRAVYLEEADFDQPVISADHQYLILAKDIENLNFTLITLIPLHNYYHKVISMFLPIIIMALILIAVAIYVGYRLARTIVSAISGLNRKMMQAEQYLKNERR